MLKFKVVIRTNFGELEVEGETVNMMLSSLASAPEEGRNIDNNEWMRKAKFEARGIVNTKQSGSE